MLDVSEQLRAWSTSLAESVEPADIDAIKVSTTARNDAFPPRRWLAIAASLVVVTTGIFAVATLGNDDPDPPSPATNPPSTSVVTETTSTPDTTDEAPSSESSVFSGNGDGVVDLERTASGPQIVVATTSGVGDFAVHTLNAAQEEVALVVDVVGPSTGRYFTNNGEFQFFRIESQGDWTIEVVDASLALIPLWAEGAYTGAGNDVLRYTGEPGMLSYSEADDPNIAVRSFGSDTGEMIVAVQAEGEWTLIIEPVP